MDIEHDKKIIESLGGTKAVCDLLNDLYIQEHKKDLGIHSHSKVIQWTKRGIPAAIKLKFPEYFAPHLVKSKRVK